jgi:DNA modification methylase
MRGSIDEVLDGRATWCQENGDCLDLCEALPDCSVHFSFTDPPYGHNNNDGDLIANRERALSDNKTTGNAPLSSQNPSRPIFNDGKEANQLFRDLVPKVARVLVKGGNYAACCGGGGGPGTCEYAHWSLWLEEHLSFKMAIVWDKGPMGLGWHYRRSYEFILVATKKGEKVRWFDKTGRVENVIRPGQYGIRKVIPRGHTYGLYSTCTVKLSSVQGGDRCESREVVRLLQKATSGITEDSLKWHTDESGENITARCRSASLSTTLTRISEITGSRTFNWSTLSPTSEYIPGAEKTNEVGGGSRANDAVRRVSSRETSTARQQKTASCQFASRAASELLSRISNEKDWQREITRAGDHPTEKPVALAAHFLRLHTEPGDVVLDPFGGSGSTGEACLKMGRRYIGFELDPQWHAHAVKRLTAVDRANDRSLVPTRPVTPRNGFHDIPKKRRGKGAF